MAIVMNSQPQQQAHVSTTVMHYLLFILIEISFQQNKKKKNLQLKKSANIATLPITVYSSRYMYDRTKILKW